MTVGKNLDRRNQRRIKVFNFSITKNRVFLLLMVSFIFSLGAVRTTGETANLQWAHEIAHAIIDKYLSVRSPKTTSEILARQVEENLHY